MTTNTSSPGPASSRQWFRNFLWRPPRPHGEVWEDREVSFLELFYDLVYVVVIAQAAHHLAHHVSWEGVFDFVVVFGLIWLAWLNGTLHHELHAREDIRSRMSIFAQMILLAVLGVYTGGATGDDGRGFALVYALLFALFTLLWFTVWRTDSDEYRPTAGRYIAMMAVATVVMVVSAFLEPEVRTYVWLGVVVAIFVVSGLISMTGRGIDSAVTASMVERFGLFTIIVLGEVVVGVVNGLSEADRTTETMAIGILSLTIGFGFWWSYFDFTGRRVPRPEQPDFGFWLIAHFPVTGAIAAAGAGMVDLIANADDDRTSTPTAWLIGGSAALLFVSLTIIMGQLKDYVRLSEVYRPATYVMLTMAGLSLVLAALAPPPLVFVLALNLLLSAAWFTGIYQFVRYYADVEGSADADPVEA